LADTEGKRLAQADDDKYEPFYFHSVDDCQVVTHLALEYDLRIGIMGAILQTEAKYDYPGGPHHDE
jgi:hypothetical protein